MTRPCSWSGSRTQGWGIAVSKAARSAVGRPANGGWFWKVRVSAEEWVRWRALDADELRWLLDTTQRGPERFGMTGPVRATLYQLAVETGLRASELRSLTRADFNLDGGEPTATVAAGYSKRRREDTLPLRADTAGALRQFPSGKLPAARVFGMPRSDKTAEMLRADLEAARQAWLEDAGTDAERKRGEGSSYLAYRDEAGRVADFHSLRHTFITNLARGGVHPKDAQALARHSTITLTMDRYSHVTRRALGRALGALPDLSVPERGSVWATGTDDAPGDGVPTGGRTGGKGVQNGVDSVRGGAAEPARTKVAGMTVSARNARDLQRTETHAKEQAATGFEPVNDGFANRSLRPLGYAATAPDPTLVRPEQLSQSSLS